MTGQDDYKTGLACAFFAYFIWGGITLYWKLLAGAGPWEIIAHRLLWTPLFVFIWLALRRELKSVIAFAREICRPEPAFGLFLAASVAAFNWWINVFATLTDHVIELGIGMFMTPLFSVLCGVVFFSERLNRCEKSSVGFAFVGLSFLMFDYGAVPWIALGVSSTWAVYGAIKKSLRLNGTLSVLAETLLLVPFAAVFLIALQAQGLSNFSFAHNATLSVALIGVGFVTVVPMAAFCVATVKLPMMVLGFCQYINPVMTIAMGAFVFGEPVTSTEISAIAFVALAALLFVFGQIKRRRAHRALL